jgi:tetratricopeptide (TPR) repeat protein
MGRIDRDYPNLRAAAHWWLNHQEVQKVLELCANIWNYWSVRGSAREGIDLVRRALASSDDVPSHVRSAALQMFGNLSVAVGDTRMARTLYEERLSIERADGSLSGIAGSLVSLGMVAMMQGRSADYPQLLEESRYIFVRIGDVRGEARSLFIEASGARNEGNLDLAETLLDQVIVLQTSLQESIGIAWSWHSLSKLALDRGELDRATEWSSMAMERFLFADDEQGIACAEEVDAMIEFAHGNLARARELLDRAFETYRSHNDLQFMAGCLENQALVAFRSGDPAAAADFLNAAIHYRDQSGCPTPPIDAHAIKELASHLSEQPQTAAT